MDKANVLPVSHIFIHAAAKMYPDLTQPLCLTVWLKKRKEKKKEKKGRLKEETSSCKDMRKKARRKLAGHYKSYVFCFSLVCHSSQIQKVWEAPRMPSKATFC